MTNYQLPAAQPQKWSPHRQGPPNTVFLRIENGAQEHEVPLNSPVRLGREASESYVTLDLSQAGGAEKGVSRSHALIMKHEDAVVIVDSGSMNGTYVNAQRVEPFVPTKIKNGDYVHLGQLMVQVRTP